MIFISVCVALHYSASGIHVWDVSFFTHLQCIHNCKFIKVNLSGCFTFSHPHRVDIHNHIGI